MAAAPRYGSLLSPQAQAQKLMPSASLLAPCVHLSTSMRLGSCSTAREFVGLTPRPDGEPFCVPLLPSGGPGAQQVLSS